MLTKIAAPFLALSLLSACPQTTSPYQTARSTVTVVRVTLKVAKTGVLAAEEVKRRSCTEAICVKVDPDKGERFKACMAEDQTAKPEYQTCMKTVNEAVVIFNKADKLGEAMCDEADNAINLAEDLNRIKNDQQKLEELCLKLDPTKGEEYKKCVAGQVPEKADWSKVLSGGACMAYHALDFIPTTFDLYVNPVRAVLNGLGNCKK